jgi:hypothetical protein
MYGREEIERIINENREDVLKPRIIGSTWTSFGREWEFLMPDGSRRWVRETSYEYDRLTK